MVRVVVLTSGELRHRFMRLAIGIDDELRVVRSYCETPDQSLEATLDRRDDVSEIERRHLAARQRSEEDFFGLFCRTVPDRSNPVSVRRSAVNHPTVRSEIEQLAPDVVAAYGCSILRRELIDAFPERIVNVHLGLSPYYRGSGTNFWALVNAEPELVGATFMYLDAGVDTGEVIHQVRARIHPGDTPHQIGNRLISDVALAYRSVLRNLSDLGHVDQLANVSGSVHRRAEVDERATRQLYENFAGGLVEEYLRDRDERVRRAPIVEHPLVLSDLGSA